jgi:hypothetical protein
MKVVSGMISSIVLLLTKQRIRMKNNTSARINPLSGFLHIARIFAEAWMMDLLPHPTAPRLPPQNVL